MKNSKRLISIAVVFLMLVALAVSFITPDTYAASQTWNVPCVSLPSAATSYYSSFTYSFEEMKGMGGTQLISYLETALKGGSVSYANQRYQYINSDADPTTPGNILLFFSAASVNGTWDVGMTYNREHVWANSKGGNLAENDLHHIRPTNPTTNGKHGNYDYGTVDRTKSVTIWTEPGAQTQNEVTGYLGTSVFTNTRCWEPSDEFKGDVARIIAYCYVRYHKNTDITTVVDNVQTLLDWNALDPVDEWEMARNNYVQTQQNNRNIFIDYPELMWIIFDQPIPDGLITPSGGTADPTPTPEGYIPPTPTPTPAPTPTPDLSGFSDWVLTPLAEIDSEDSVVITMTLPNSTVYVLPNNSGSTPLASTISVTGNRLTSTPALTLQWNVKPEGSGYAFYVYGSNSSWLYTTAANTGIRIGAGSTKEWVLNSSGLKFTGTSRYLCVYTGTPDWRSYNVGSITPGTLGFYVKSANAPTPTPTLTPTPTPPTTLRGDANCDTSVNAADAALILRWLAGLSDISEQGLLNAEVTDDGVVNAADAAKILRWLAGLVDIL
ncbi:MAG: endonuclease [Clostridiales bacterium]|nr:endonuclease [Clostridiales bacterium]